MATYHELLKQREALEEQIQAARKTELANAIAQVRGIISEYGLTSEDVFAPVRKTRNTAGQKVAPKYRDPASGETWTGRGKPPRWISEAADRESFAIKPEQ
jgi:DNA-binding protein H-NS